MHVVPFGTGTAWALESDWFGQAEDVARNQAGEAQEDAERLPTVEEEDEADYGGATCRVCREAPVQVCSRGYDARWGGFEPLALSPKP